MKSWTIRETARFLRAHDCYCILTHRRPDGDTLGSAAALCLGLRQLGKTAVVLENPETTPRYAWLLEGLTVPAIPEDFQVVTVDVASADMLPVNARSLTEAALRLDHHSAGTSFTEQELVVGDSASCAEIIWDLLAEMGVILTPAVADGIYVGVSTDTGCFRYANVTDHSFAAAAACAKAGARVYELNQELFETNSLARLRIQGWIVENMQLFQDGRLALVAIPRGVEQKLGVTEDDMDNISSFPRTVAGVCLSATLRQTRYGAVKISVRAIPGWDATRVVAPLGGGGHKGAAGATVEMDLEAAAAAVRQAMLEL